MTMFAAFAWMRLSIVVACGLIVIGHGIYWLSGMAANRLKFPECKR